MSNSSIIPRKGVRIPKDQFKMTHRPEIIDPMTRIENTLRGTVGGHTSTWTCHLCDESFQEGVDPWIHAEEMHQVSTVAGSRDELEAKKKRVLQRAIGLSPTTLGMNLCREQLPPKSQQRALLKRTSSNEMVSLHLQKTDLKKIPRWSQRCYFNRIQNQYPMSSWW